MIQQRYFRAIRNDVPIRICEHSTKGKESPDNLANELFSFLLSIRAERNLFRCQQVAGTAGTPAQVSRVSVVCAASVRNSLRSITIPCPVHRQFAVLAAKMNCVESQNFYGINQLVFMRVGISISSKLQGKRYH